MNHHNRRGVVPSRTRGSLGLQDAADPSTLMCVPGDTPGPAGVGGDASSRLCLQESTFVDVFLIEEKRVLARIRRAAVVRGALRSAQQDFAEHVEGSDLTANYQRDLEMDRLTEEWARCKRAGADATLDFCDRIGEQADDDFAELMRLYKSEASYARFKTEVARHVGKLVVHVRLAAKVVRKFASLTPNPIGWGIDVVTDVAEAGINEYSAGGADADTRAALAEVQKLAEELAKKGVETAPEILQLVMNAYGAEATAATVEALEQRVAQLQTKLARQGKIADLARQQWVMKRTDALLKKARVLLLKRKAALLPLRWSKWLARKGFGETVGFVFVAKEVADALEEWQKGLKEFDDV